MGWFGKGKFIGTDRDNDLNKNINNAYGVWSVTDVGNYAKNLRWAFPAVALAATGGSISTVTVGSTSYRVHEFTNTDNFTIYTSSTEPLTIECVGAGGNTGNPAGYSVNNPGCSGYAVNFGGAGGGANVVVGTGFQFANGVYTVNVGDPINGSSFVGPSGIVIKSSNGGTGGSATGSPSSGQNGSGGSGGIAGTSFVQVGISYTTYSGGSGGSGGGIYGCDCNASYGGGAGGNPGYNLLIPLIPTIPQTFAVYKNTISPIIPTNRNKGLGNGATSGGPGCSQSTNESNLVGGGGTRGGIVRIIYKFIQ